jgi:hypothetical protein
MANRSPAAASPTYGSKGIDAWSLKPEHGPYTLRPKSAAGRAAGGGDGQPHGPPSALCCLRRRGGARAAGERRRLWAAEGGRRKGAPPPGKAAAVSPEDTYQLPSGLLRLLRLPELGRADDSLQPAASCTGYDLKNGQSQHSERTVVHTLAIATALSRALLLHLGTLGLLPCILHTQLPPCLDLCAALQIAEAHSEMPVSDLAAIHIGLLE